MKRTLAFLALLLVVLSACNPQDTTANPPPASPPAVPLNPDEALGATAHLVNALDAALYLEAGGNLLPLTNDLPPLARALIEDFGFDLERLTFTPDCSVSRNDSDGDNDGVVAHNYTVGCGASQDDRHFVAFAGQITTGDPDDESPDQPYTYGYLLDNFGVFVAAYDAGGQLISTTMTLSGHVNFDPTGPLVRHEPDFEIRVQHNVGSERVFTLFFFPAHPTLIADSDPATATFTLRPQAGDYGVPSWSLNYGDYVEVVAIDRTAGDPVYDPTCLPARFRSGSLTYTDANGKAIGVTYAGCDVAPELSGTLLP